MRRLRPVVLGFLLIVLVPAGAVAAPPQITVPGHVVAEAQGPTGADVSYTVTATNAAGKPANVSCTPPGVAAAGTLTVTAHFPLGDTTVTCTVGDNGTVDASASFTVTVQDTTAPALASAPPISVEVAAGVTSTPVNFAKPTAVDVVDGSVPVSCSPPSGSVFSVGTTTVTCTATDSHGNTATTSFSVTVVAPGSSAPPPPPQTAPPATTPPAARDFVPPGEVANLRVESTQVVRLSWQVPSDPDFDHSEVIRLDADDTSPTTVFRGSGSTVTDRDVKAGRTYRYVISTLDRAGNRSRGISVTASTVLMLLAPRDGTVVRRPPNLVWRRFPSAAYYNVQLFFNAQKVLSAWPTRARFQLHKAWRFSGRNYKLRPGTYSWFVWPGLGPRSGTEYGPLLGVGRFAVRR
jgi:hypothetical protein